MKSADATRDGVEPEPQKVGNDDSVKAEDKKTSRLDRLKKKIKKLQGKDPDIYPMW